MSYDEAEKFHQEANRARALGAAGGAVIAIGILTRGGSSGISALYARALWYIYGNPPGQDAQDENAKKHDIANATFGNRSLQGLKADAKFIYNSVVIVAKKVDNDIIVPITPGLSPNKDHTTGNPITAKTAYERAAPTGAFITLWTAAKVIVAVTYDPAVKGYNNTVDYLNELGDKTAQGLNNLNWGK